MDIGSAVRCIESVAGFTEPGTPEGQAWETVCDHIADLEARLRNAERQRDEANARVEHYQQTVAEYAAKEAGLRDELRSANERLAGVVAALKVADEHIGRLVSGTPSEASFDAWEDAKALSAAGAEVVKGFAEDFDPGVKGYTHTVAIVWTDHAEGRVPCYLVTLKEAEHDAD